MSALLPIPAGTFRSDLPFVPAPEPDPDAADDLLRYLCDRGGLEFDGYHRDSLLRRVRDRMRRAGILSFPDYRTFLEEDADEHGRLCEGIPVPCTEFFRDPDDWAYLAAQVLPGLLAAKADGEPIRMWSAGCATGEEAYTLVVLLAEALGPYRIRDRVTIFATDVSDRCLGRARTGRYPGYRMGGVPADLRDRYFWSDGGDWVVRPDLRACLLFGRHDLLRDPPYSGLDLIACRNTLIYFTLRAQSRELARLGRVLFPGGVLFAGRSEFPHVRSALFEAESLNHRVFRRA
jgi:two-component system, chemotaxis family, CheB/CheR fusion protein